MPVQEHDHIFNEYVEEYSGPGGVIYEVWRCYYPGCGVTQTTPGRK